jgi:NADPH-dependent glutamate synthase beta subunit-like oxidoreductase
MYINRIKEKAEEEAYHYIAERNPFPSICGRVCHHPCERACRRGRFDEPLAVRELKRFVADRYTLTPSASDGKKGKVAIVGAGPAGLSAAWVLAKAGYEPTVFEKEVKAGGWMRYGIPDYRLPKDVLDKEIDAILAHGVKISFGVAFGKDRTLDSLKTSGFKAILVATGSQKGRKLNIPGEDLKGAVQGLDLLRTFNRGAMPEVGKEVLVIGGGNVAIDAARVALRLGGSNVTLLYRRGLEQMPADPDEVKEAHREGIEIRTLAAPVEFKGAEGRVRQVICQEMVLGALDESGRPTPLSKENSTFSIPADQVICAVGQETDLSFLDHGQTVDLNQTTLETSLSGVFVAGDAVTGPATVTEAIASGLRAATSIRQHLSGEKVTGDFVPDLDQGAKAPFGIYDYPVKSERLVPGTLPLQRRKKSFAEVGTGYTDRKAVHEADRCWHCDLINDAPSFNEKCVQCNVCASACPTKSIPVLRDLIPGTATCDHCPVGCQIKEGYKGACLRYTNVGGLIETAEPLKFPERETLDEMKRNFALSAPLVSAVDAGTTYPDFKPAPLQVEDRVDGFDVVTVVTGAPLTYSSILVKIDTDKPIGKEGAPVYHKKREVGHVTTEQYGSKMVSLGGINLMKTDYNALVTRLMVGVANKESFSLEVEGGAKLELRVGETPIINGKPGEKMKVACGAGLQGIFGNLMKDLADEIIVLDSDITGLFSQGHVGHSLGFKDTGIRPPGTYATPGRYFGSVGQGWGGTPVKDPMGAIREYDRSRIFPGMKVLVLETSGQHVAMLEADEKGDFHKVETPADARELRDLVAMNSEPSLTSALYVGGCGGSARAGKAQNPVKLTQAVHEGRVKLTLGGVPAYVFPGGGINFIVDVGKMKWRSFTWVAVPAVVAPIEYTMEKRTFVELGGPVQNLKLLSDLKAEEERKWKRNQ